MKDLYLDNREKLIEDVKNDLIDLKSLDRETLIFIMMSLQDEIESRATVLDETLKRIKEEITTLKQMNAEP